jgi:hypothetical protein
MQFANPRRHELRDQKTSSRLQPELEAQIFPLSEKMHTVKIYSAGGNPTPYEWSQFTALGQTRRHQQQMGRTGAENTAL